MTATAHYYGQSDEASIRLKAIEAARIKAYRQIESVAHELMLELGCSAADANCLLNHAHDGLEDMLTDVIERWEDERNLSDEAISNIEEADLRLSAPVTL